MEIFWKTIAYYNSATWIYQLLIIVAGLHDGQELLLAAGFDELFDITVEFEVDFGVLSKHCFFP